MLEQANMNNTSFSRIQNIDRITDMGYSLNRVSPILGEQQTPAQSTKPRNPTSTPRRNVGHINKSSVPQVLIHNRAEGHHLMTPTARLRTIYREQAAGSNNQTQSAQAPTPNTINNNNSIPFQNSQKRVTNTTGPAGQRGNKYSQPSNKGTG